MLTDYTPANCICVCVGPVGGGLGVYAVFTSVCISVHPPVRFSSFGVRGGGVSNKHCLLAISCLSLKLFVFHFSWGWSGVAKVSLYLTSPGCPTDIGLQFGKACYPCNR